MAVSGKVVYGIINGIGKRVYDGDADMSDSALHTALCPSISFERLSSSYSVVFRHSSSEFVVLSQKLERCLRLIAERDMDSATVWPHVPAFTTVDISPARAISRGAGCQGL